MTGSDTLIAVEWGRYARAAEAFAAPEASKTWIGKVLDRFEVDFDQFRASGCDSELEGSEEDRGFVVDEELSALLGGGECSL